MPNIFDNLINYYSPGESINDDALIYNSNNSVYVQSMCWTINPGATSQRNHPAQIKEPTVQ